MELKLTNREIEVAISHLSTLKMFYEDSPVHYGQQFINDALEMTNMVVKAIKDGTNTINPSKRLAENIGYQFALMWYHCSDDKEIPFLHNWATLAYKIYNSTKPNYNKFPWTDDCISSVNQYIWDCSNDSCVTSSDDDFMQLMGL